ncbi:hypothetical protein [Massilia suwonensis]|uniref:Uncharacterized protein n=1 Tax=Massilia suwonensis TaxID=648895 RepID=A0ABW0MM04_9BURK
MFFIRHPKPVVDGRAVAVQVVQQKAARTPAANVLVAAELQPHSTNVPTSAETDVPIKDQ